MSKRAEEAAYNYAKENGTLGYDYNQVYDAAKHGYEQAEKDLALTWEDITTLIRLCEQVKTEWWFRDMKGIGTQKFFEEVLRRFLEQTKK